MKLSDAIALGRTLMKSRPGTLNGCAQGMALAACGRMEEVINPSYGQGIQVLWRWVEGPLEVSPCGHKLDPHFTENYRACIAHLFDEHVFGAKDWTLDQLIDWVRSVEPAEAPSEAEKQHDKEFERMEIDFWDSRANTR